MGALSLTRRNTREVRATFYSRLSQYGPLVGKKEGEQKGSARGSVYWGCYYATALDIEVDVCVFITAGPTIKLCAGGEGDSEGHVL